MKIFLAFLKTLPLDWRLMWLALLPLILLGPLSGAGDSRTRAIASHEAGHVIVARWGFGYRVSMSSANTRRGVTTIPKLGKRVRNTADLWREGAITVAGIAAEAISDKTKIHDSSSDLRHMRRLAADLRMLWYAGEKATPPWPPRTTLRKSGVTYVDFFHECYAQARIILGDHPREKAEIVRLLLTNRKISEQQIEWIFSDSSPSP